MLAEKYADRIAKIRSKYPDLRSTVMPLLYLAQEEYNGLNDNALREVADLCSLDPTEVKTIAGFYTMYWEEGKQREQGHGYQGDGKKGRYWLQVCTDLPCALRGADEFYEQLKDYLGVQEGGTTPDGMFTVEHVMCLAACDKAPMLQCNFHFVEHLNMDIMKEKLEEWRTQGFPEPVIQQGVVASAEATESASKPRRSQAKAPTAEQPETTAADSKPKTPRKRKQSNE